MLASFRSIVGLGFFAVAGAAGILPGCGTTTDPLGNDAGQGGAGSGGRAAAGKSGTGGTSGAAPSAGAPGDDAGQNGTARGGAAGKANESAAGSSRGGSSAGRADANAGHAGTGTTSHGGKSGAGGGETNGGAGAGGDEANGGAGAGGACDGSRTITATPVIPTVELLVDTSSSMFETAPTTWSVLYDALMNPDTGVVKPLEQKMRFGFVSYKGHQGTSETDPACATMTAVAPALGNYDAIDAVYASVGAGYDEQHPTPERWETPTNYAIGYAASLLVADTTDSGPKYILLATDGNPNTCEVVDPQCGQDRAVRAAQDAYAAGVGMFVLGVGDIINQPNSGCDANYLRCGELHLQDLANAGMGAPVLPPPNCDDPSSASCVAKYEACNQDALIASYTPGAEDAGTPFAVDTSASDAATQLQAALSSLLSGAISCTIPIDGAVSAGTHLAVTVGDTPRQEGDADGWVLESDGRHVTLRGRACIDFKALEPLKLNPVCP